MADQRGLPGLPLSGYTTRALGLSDGALRVLRDLIAERTGVHYGDDKSGLLADKLADLLLENGLTSFLDYYYLLKHDPDAGRHWNRLADRLAVPETFFWRQAEQFELLARLIVPRHLRDHPGRRLRIWSAACCTGEEPLSIAIALAEAGRLGELGDRIQIVATDASLSMLDRARSGVYGERSFRALPVSLRQKYFVEERSGWRIDRRMLDAVQWDRANLADPRDMARFADADVVFCRNVFIYFSDDAIRRTVQVLGQHMPPQGWLFLGAAESLTRFDCGFELHDAEGVFVYVRPDHPDLEARRARASAGTGAASPAA